MRTRRANRPTRNDCTPLSDRDYINQLLLPQNVCTKIRGTGAGGAHIVHYGILMAVDEVVAGVARTGFWWAYAPEGIEPDLMTFTRGLASGYSPPGAVAVICSRSGSLAHGLTFGGRPVSAATGPAALQIMERERLVDNAARIQGAVLSEKLDQLAAQSDPIRAVQGRGLMQGLVLESLLGRSNTVSTELAEDAFERGLLVYPGGGSGSGLKGGQVLIGPPLISAEPAGKSTSRVIRLGTGEGHGATARVPQIQIAAGWGWHILNIRTGRICSAAARLILNDIRAGLEASVCPVEHVSVGPDLFGEVIIRYTKELLPVIFSQWIVSLADGVLIPFVSIYLVRDLGLAPAWVGIIVGISGLGIVAGQLPGGALADRLGVSRMIVVGLTVAACANLLAGLTRNPVLFGAAYGVAFFASASISPAFYGAAAAQVGQGKNLRSVGLLITAQNGGIAAGALVAWPFLSMHLGSIFFLAAFIDVVGIGVAWRFVTRPQPDRGPRAFQWSDWISLPPRENRMFWPVALAGFLLGVLYSQMWSTVPIVWAHRAGAASVFALLWFLNGAAIFTCERPIARALEHRSPKFWMAAAGIIYGMALGLFNLGDTLPVLVVSFGVLTLAELIYEPFPPTFYSAAAPTGHQARFQAAGNVTNAAGLVVGPVIGDLLLQWNRPDLVWSLMAVLGLLSALSIVRARTPHAAWEQISNEVRDSFE
ncbi:MAG: aminotransferase class III-fold pyridoxal phosphate-dependent enzyme [Thermaerobacter sp.]|nr:aminotransferase class III-fold pyridoxal phosphate-dependent enzyme [Thermaerobacter sp.]